MGRRKKAAEMQVYTAPVRPMTLGEALRSLPDEKTAFDKLRYRWRDVVRLCPALTGAQRQVGQVICDQFLNRMPNHPWRYSAWPSYDTIAAACGYDRRTVASSLKELVRIGLLVVQKGAGLAGLGGKTSRMTIRVDRLAELEQAYAHFVNNEKARTLASLYGASTDRLERGETISEKTGNLDGKEVKKDHPTPLKYNLPESRSSDRYPTRTLSSTIQPGLSNEEDRVTAMATAPDHLALAKLVGYENVEQGFVRLSRLDVSVVDELALQLRDNPTSSLVILEHVRIYEQS